MFYSQSTKGFYDATIHGSSIPPDSVIITAEEHRSLLAAQTQGKIIQADANGRPVAVEPPAPSVEALRAAKILAIKAAFEAFLASQQPEYGIYSMQTWQRQAEEAEDLLEGRITEAGAVNLYRLVAGRIAAGGQSITLIEQAKRIRANRLAWEALGLYAEGQRNGFVDRAQASATPEDLNAVPSTPEAFSVPPEAA